MLNTEVLHSDRIDQRSKCTKKVTLSKTRPVPPDFRQERHGLNLGSKVQKPWTRRIDNILHAEFCNRFLWENNLYKCNRAFTRHLNNNVIRALPLVLPVCMQLYDRNKYCLAVCLDKRARPSKSTMLTTIWAVDTSPCTFTAHGRGSRRPFPSYTFPVKIYRSLLSSFFPQASRVVSLKRWTMIYLCGLYCAFQESFETATFRPDPILVTFVKCR